MSALVFSGHGWSLPVFNLGIRYRYDGGMEAIYRPELEQPLPYKQSSGDSNKASHQTIHVFSPPGIVLVKRYCSTKTTQETTGNDVMVINIAKQCLYSSLENRIEIN
jgi:hypothetical protein